LKGNTENEQKLYGESWNRAFGGYFSDPDVAAPMVKAVVEAAELSGPAVIVDLGGGTGFLLAEIADSLGPDGRSRLVCVDEADAQLEDCPEGIETLDSRVETVWRSQLAREGETLMLCMRSVLHYFGEDGLRPELAKIRSLLIPGEYFVHQTICMENEADRAISNLLYMRMDTGKWYPMVNELLEAVESQGFLVESVVPAPPFDLTQVQLEERYGIARDRMEEIRDELESVSPAPRALLRGENTFTIRLDYQIMTCVAQ